MRPDVPPPAKPRRPWRRHLRPLPMWIRIGLYFTGWLCVLIGIAGLALPGIQGILTLLVGGSILSLASPTAHRWLRQLMRRWPRGWRIIERMRRKVHRKLSPDD